MDAANATTITPAAVNEAVGAAVHGTTFADLFLAAPYNPWLLLAVAFFAGFAGMATHWLKVSFKEGTSVSFFDWFFKYNLKGTLFSTMSMCGALFTVFAPLDYTTITIFQVVSQAWAVGYASDSIFNSATRIALPNGETAPTGD
jgi:hypothetical protein